VPGGLSRHCVKEIPDGLTSFAVEHRRETRRGEEMYRQYGDESQRRIAVKDAGII
jgi:hypothetical protein